MKQASSSMHRLLLASLAVAALAAGSQSVLGQSAETAGAIDRDALAALDRMGTYLRTLDTFKVTADTATEYVLDDGQVLETIGRVDLTVRRPDGLFAEVKTDATVRQLFYDGKTFTIFAPALGYYAKSPAPATLGEAAEALERDLSVDLPLADLFMWGTDNSGADQIKTAMVLEPAQIGGDTCDHFAFQQQDVDWQVWIRQGETPLPCKLTITTKDDEAQPKHTSVLAWSIDPAVSDATFTFVAPANATEIEISKADANGGSQ